MKRLASLGCLFVGGPHDGEWENLPTDVGDYVERRNPAPAPTFRRSPSMNDSLTTTVYRKHLLVDEEGIGYRVFSPDGTNVLEKLIRNYKP